MRRMIIFALMAWLTLQPHTDPDLGWHLRYGQYFFQTGHVLRDNITSFVWPKYQWVQASWGYDLIAYQIFRYAGFFGLSLAGSLVTVIIFSLLLAPMRRFNFWQLLFLGALFLSQAAPLYGGGLRAQTLSALLFALAMICAWRSLIQPSRTCGLPTPYFFPLLFFLWANLHGGFALGLILLWLMWGISGVLKTTNRNTWLVCGASLALSTLTPLLNPWGRRIYEETLKHSSNLNLVVINEWLPLATWKAEAVIAALVGLSVIAVAILHRQSTHLPYLLAFLATTYLAFSASRFTINFGIMATWYLAQVLPQSHLPDRFARVVMNPFKIVFVSLIFFDVFLFKRYFIPLNPFRFPASWDAICNIAHQCSTTLAQTMNANPPVGNGFHPYNWGGFLIWNVPTVKTFLDGRMAAWEENGKTPPILEGDTINTSKSPVVFKRFEEEYEFRWAIIPSSAPLARYLDALVKQGTWELRYKDEWHSYYVKKYADSRS